MNIDVRTLSEVPIERVTWLWPGYLPAGKMVVIDGDPSVGKSTLTNDLAARCSTGRDWPDGSANRGPRGVVLLSAEDGLGDTIAPRLAAAGADLNKVHALVSVPRVDDDGNVRNVPPSLPADIPAIESTIIQTKAALVIVDVLMAYLAGGVDSHRDQDVRGVLALLAAMAERTGATIILVRHLNKAGGGNALYRGGGSIGIVGAARAAYLVGRDPEDTDRRVLACTKLNIAAEPATLAYRLVSDDSLGCARVEWEAEPLDGVTAASLLQAPASDDERTERDEISRWITDYLTDAGGSAPANDVRKAAGAAGLQWPAVQKARGKVANTSREGFGPGSAWYWSLRTTDHRSPIDHIDSRTNEPVSMESMAESMQPPTKTCPGCGTGIKDALSRCVGCALAKKPATARHCESCGDAIPAPYDNCRRCSIESERAATTKGLPQ